MSFIYDRCPNCGKLFDNHDDIDFFYSEEVEDEVPYYICPSCGWKEDPYADQKEKEKYPNGMVKLPDGGIDDLSDGFHTFNQLYY